MAYKINGTTVVDNSRNVCACCVTSCCITASSRMDVPSGTTAQRPGSPATGSIYFDTDEGSLVSYDGSAWNAVGGGAGLEIENLTTSNTDAWHFGTMYHCDEQYRTCFIYNQTCHGCTDISPANSAMGVSCVQNEIYCIDHCGNPYRWSACTSAYFYVPGPYPQCSYYVCSAFNHGWGWSVPVTYKGGQPGCMVCQCLGGIGAFGSYFVNGNDGSIVNYLYSRSICYGQHPLTSGTCLYNWNETYVNKNGGMTSHQMLVPFTCICSNSGCYKQPYGRFHHFRYHGSTSYGAIAGARIPLCMFDRASKNFDCPAAFLVTSDTFGNGNEEVCCWAWRIRSGNISGWPGNYHIGGHYALNDCMCICPAITLCGDTCFWCLARSPMQQHYHCPCTWFTRCIGSLMSSRTDIFGGGDATMCDLYDKNVCSYVTNGVFDCMQIKSSQPSCCPFMIMVRYGDQNNCYCFGTLAEGIGCGCCGVAWLSRDGCCIHYHVKNNAINPDTCNLKIDSVYPTCKCCQWNLYDGVLNRVCQCQKCSYGSCDLCWTCAQCCLGCTKNNAPFDVYNIGHANCMYQQGWHTPTQWVNDGKISNCASILPACNYSGEAQNCSFQHRTLIDFSWNAWSHYCCRKAIFHAFHCYAPTVTIFDCCKGLMERNINLEHLHSGCEWMKFLQIYAMGPNKICNCATANPAACYFANCCGSNCHQCLAQCICAITGCGERSLFFHCYGYSPWRQTHTMSYLGFLPPGQGWSQNTYRNKENDHLVMIRVLKHDSKTCTCGGDYIFWVGAICYDIHNNCISKVNTYFPSDTTHLQRLDSLIYCCWCNGAGDPVDITERAMITNKMRCGSHDLFNFNNTSCKQSTKYISVTPYGSRQYWIDSGCTDTGGVTLVMSNMPGEKINVCCCSCRCAHYYACQACSCGCCQSEGISGYMRIVPGVTQVLKVPYSKPLECVGWRSQPDFANWLNEYFFPTKRTNPSFPMTTGSTAHKCWICCQETGTTFPHHIRHYPCNRVYPYQCRLYWPIYGGQDCQHRGMRFKFMKSSCCFWFNCCCVTGVANGNWCSKMLCTHHFCRYGLNGCTTTCTTIYDQICACHLDSSESSKRYISRFMDSDNNLKARPYYVDGSGNRFSESYIKFGNGESPNDRFHRLWNEDIIQCC